MSVPRFAVIDHVHPFSPGQLVRKLGDRAGIDDIVRVAPGILSAPEIELKVEVLRPVTDEEDKWNVKIPVGIIGGKGLYLENSLVLNLPLGGL